MAATLVWKLTGGAANADPNASLGGTRSSVSLSGTALNNLFDDVSPAESSAGDTEYRALDLYNSGDATAGGVVVFMSTETASSGTSLDFGVDASPINSNLSVVDESTAPAGVSFSHYTTGSKLSLPDIAASGGCRVWFKRIVGASTGNLNPDQGAFTAEYA